MLEGKLIQAGRRLGPAGASVGAAGSVDDGLHSDGGCVFVLVDRVELPASGPGLWRWRPLK